MATKTYDGSSTQEISFTADLAGNLLQVSNIDGWSEYRSGDDLIIFSSDKTNYLRVIGAYASATKLDFIEYFFDGKSSGEIRSVSTIATTPASGLHFIAGTFENDTIDGASASSLSATGYLGNDNITGTVGRDYLGGNEGNDTIIGLDGDDLIIGGEGDDYLEDGYGSDEVYGGAGDDTINNIGGSDLFDGGDGSDTLITDISTGFDERSFEIGFDTVAGTHGRLNSDLGQDTIADIENFTLKGNFNAVVTGGDEDNIFTTDAGDDVIRGGAGDDRLSAWIGNDEVYAGSGNDTIINTGGEDLFDGGEGVDTLITDLSQSVKDKLGFSDWDFDIVFDLTAEDPHMRHYGVKPDGTDYAWDEIYGIENYTLIGDFDIELTGDDQANILVSDSGDDVIRGGDGDDTLNAGSGDDQLYGGAGNDTLVQSGSGKQIFDGGAGVDTLYNNTDNYNNGLDADPPSWTAAINLSTGFLGVLEAPDHPTTDTVLNIENVHVEGRWNWEITGDGKANLLQSGSGDDVIAGGYGDDFIDAGDGTDYVNGGFGNDTYQVIDNLDDFIEFTDPNNLDLSNHIYITDDGGENDVVAIADTPGRDSYRFVNTADSVIFQFASGRQVEMMKSDNGSLSVETFRWFHEEHFGLDYSPYSKDFEIVIDPENIRDLSTMFAGTDLGDTVVLPSLSDAISQDNSNGWAEIYLNAGDDIVTMSKDLNFIVHMGAGNDTGYGQDKFSGSIDLGHGDDVYYGGDGDDRVSGSAGDDVLRGGNGDDILKGAGGDWVWGAGIGSYTDNDTLIGGAGDDTLDGGAGDDILHGGEGDDTYHYRYLGNDTVSDSGGNDDALYITARDINHVGYFGNSYVEDGDLILTSRQDATKSLTVENAFDETGRIEKAIFHAESGAWDDLTYRIASLDDQFIGNDILYFGTRSDDTLVMNEGYNEAVLSDGDDTVYAGDGGSWIFAGEGNDKVVGGAGNDYIVTDYRYIEGSGTDLVESGAGNDTIILDGNGTYSSAFTALNISSSIQTGTEERIKLAGKTRFEDVMDGGGDVDTVELTEASDAFFLHDSFSGFHSSLTLSNDYNGNSGTARIKNIENINSGDGDDIIDLTSPDYSLAGQNITVDGGEGDDTLWGSDANETLKGGNGDDVFFGGAGINELIGGSGADEFQFTKTSSNDTIADFNISDGDTLKFFNTGGAQFDRDSIALSSAGDELSIAYGSDADDVLTISLTNAGLQLNDLTTDVLIIA